MMFRASSRRRLTLADFAAGGLFRWWLGGLRAAAGDVLAERNCLERENAGLSRTLDRLRAEVESTREEVAKLREENLRLRQTLEGCYADVLQAQVALEAA